MAMPVNPDIVSFPYGPDQRISNDAIWGGTGGPSPDDVPDGTPADVKKRLGQILLSGAQTILAALQYKISPQPQTGSVERPGTQVPEITASGTVGVGAHGEEKGAIAGTIHISGTPSKYTQTGLYVGAALLGLLVLSVFSKKSKGE